MTQHLALIARTTSLIAAGDIVGAESALAELADTEGDGALVEVLAQFEPEGVSAVVREYDDAEPSAVGLLVTPEQFARAMVLEKKYKDLTHTYLRNMVNAVVFRDGGDPLEFLSAIGDLEGGSEALAHYFEEKWSRIEAFARTGHFDTSEDDGAMLSDDALLASLHVRPHIDLDEVADRDWMQMAWLLRYECRDLFIETLLVLRAKARAHDQGLADGEEAEEDDGVIETSDTDRGRATPAARGSDEESAI